MTPLAGKTVCVTGTLSVTRDVIERVLRAERAIVAKTVGARTDYLIAGSDPGDRKLAAARRYGIQVIDEATLKTWLASNLPKRDQEPSPREFARNFVTEPESNPNADLIGKWFRSAPGRDGGRRRQVARAGVGGVMCTAGITWDAAFVAREPDRERRGIDPNDGGADDGGRSDGVGPRAGIMERESGRVEMRPLRCLDDDDRGEAVHELPTRPAARGEPSNVAACRRTGRSRNCCDDPNTRGSRCGAGRPLLEARPAQVRAMKRLCAICNRRPRMSGFMCAPCRRSYDRSAFRSGTVWEAMAWAARRARSQTAIAERRPSDGR